VKTRDNNKQLGVLKYRSEKNETLLLCEGRHPGKEPKHIRVHSHGQKKKGKKSFQLTLLKLTESRSGKEETKRRRKAGDPHPTVHTKKDRSTGKRYKGE